MDIDKNSLGKHLLELAILLIALCTYFSVANLVSIKGREKTEATVSEIVRNEYRRSSRRSGYDVYVDYTYDGVIYQNIKLGKYKSPFIMFGDEGSDCTIYIDKNDPTDIEHLNIFPFIGLPITIIMGVVGYRMKKS